MQDQWQVPEDVEAEVLASITSSPGGWTHTPPWRAMLMREAVKSGG